MYGRFQRNIQAIFISKSENIELEYFNLLREQEGVIDYDYFRLLDNEEGVQILKKLFNELTDSEWEQILTNE